MKLKNLHNIGVSVVIVCYNSSERILPTLYHLASQEGIEFPCEIILVDNNSSDNTAQIAIRYWNRLNPFVPFITVTEKRPGTMYARHKGIISANYRYVTFVDDDNWLCPCYLKTAFDIIKFNPEIAAVGGRGIMEFKKGYSPPAWIYQFEKSFGCGPQGNFDGDTTTHKGCLYTAGAIIDRFWLNRLFIYGFQSTLSGRIGNKLIAGEDTELTYALKLVGGKLYYSSLMEFKHYIPDNRLKWNYLKKLWRSFGYSDFLISPYNAYFSKQGRLYIVNTVYRLFANLLIHILLSFLISKKEGNIHTLKVYRALGGINALFTNFGTHIKNKEMVHKLALFKNF